MLAILPLFYIHYENKLELYLINDYCGIEDTLRFTQSYCGIKYIFINVCRLWWVKYCKNALFLHWNSLSLSLLSSKFFSCSLNTKALKFCCIVPNLWFNHTTYVNQTRYCYFSIENNLQKLARFNIFFSWRKMIRNILLNGCTIKKSSINKKKLESDT